MAATSLDGDALLARAGDRDALERLVLGLKDDLFRLCLRMLGNVADAEDATQEALILAITRLGGFRGDSSVRTWAWSIATRFVLRKRSRQLAAAASFDQLGEMIDAGATACPVPLEPLEIADLADEVRLGCTQAMLSALDPDHRIVYILADIFGVESDAGGEIVGIAPPAFRKRLSRARARLGEFMRRRCGLVDAAAACRCLRQIPVLLERRLLVRERLVRSQLARARPARVVEAWDELDHIDRAARVLREDCTELAGPELTDRIRRILAVELRVLS